MQRDIVIETLENGLTVLVEEMPHVASVAIDLLIPGGIVRDPQDRVGASLLLAELTSRGAGGLSARELSDKFDELGARHGESAGHDRFSYSSLVLPDTVPQALKLMSLMVLRPDFPEAEIDPIKSVLLQDIASLRDDPARRSMVELAKRYYPAPFNRPSHGSSEGIEPTKVGDLRSLWEASYCSNGSILSVAGKVRAADFIALARECFGSWKGVAADRPAFGQRPAPFKEHIAYEGAQLQMALAYPSAEFGDRDYYVAKVAAGVLSGGMFGRLFIEVREKRGLCYSVYARHVATNQYGTMTCYAGTTPERASETLEVMVAELGRVVGTITADELLRAKANIKTSLVLGEESSSSRASSNAADWWLLKRIRPLKEIENGIEKVTAVDIDNFVQRFPPSNHSLLTLGTRATAA